VLGVRRSYVTVRRAPTSSDADDDHIPALAQPTPFALHPPDAPRDVEREIAARLLHDRLQHRNAQLRGGGLYLELRNGTLDV